MLNLKLTTEIRQHVVKLSLSDPIRNSLMLADVTQLEKDCYFTYLRSGDTVDAALSVYSGFDLPAIAYVGDNTFSFWQLIDQVKSGGLLLDNEPIWIQCSKELLEELKKRSILFSLHEEYRMVLQNSKIGSPASPCEKADVRLLSEDDIPQIKRLYTLVKPVAWSEKHLQYGPYYGAFVENQLVSIAGVHYVTPWVSEIGNIVTHPSYRRLGLGTACVHKLIETLRKKSRHIFLCVFVQNKQAISMYEKLNFKKAGVVYLAKVILSPRY